MANVQNNSANNPSSNIPADSHSSLRIGKPTGRRKWIYRFIAMFIIPLMIFGLLEIALRIGGYGYDTIFFIDGSDIERSEVYIDNHNFGLRFMPADMEGASRPVQFSMPKSKGPGVRRVFILGESAAMGFPDPSMSFSRILEVMLQAQYPDVKFEIVNTAMVAINSHVVLSIAKDCMRHDPDLFVVLMGNNEVVGPFGAAGVLGPFSPNRGVIKSNLAIKSQRSGQLFNSAIQSIKSTESKSRSWKGMATFAESHVRVDDPRLERIYSHFEGNLVEICSLAKERSIPVVVCTVPVNLRDCAPFYSEHKSELSPENLQQWDRAFRAAIEKEGQGNFADADRLYQEANSVDDQYAELAYRRGRCLYQLGKYQDAREQFERARDLDALRFRTDSKINSIIRNISEQSHLNNVFIADSETLFNSQSPNGIVGDNYFLEHVHMNFSGNYQLAKTVREILPTTNIHKRVNATAAFPSEVECANALAYNDWVQHKTYSQIISMFRAPPFNGQCDRNERDSRWKSSVDAIQIKLDPNSTTAIDDLFEKATANRPYDWMIRMHYGVFLTERQNPTKSEDQYRAALKSLRHCYPAHVKIGNIMMSTGRAKQAIAEYEEALKQSPDYPEAEIGKAFALGSIGKFDDGLTILNQRLQKSKDPTPDLIAIANYLLQANRFEAAKEKFLEALQKEPEPTIASTIHIKIADIELQQGKKEQAIVNYEQALKIGPNNPQLQTHVNNLKSSTK